MAIKKVGLFAIVLMFAAALMAGCSGSNAGNDNPAGNGGQTGGTAETERQDLKPAELKMVLLGDVPADLDVMLGELNKLIQRDLNATLSIEYLAWSDWTQKYSLILASGEPIDLIYTSDWAKYVSEATKGAFLEITDEILTKYMPLTKESQDPISFEQAKINGKIYFVPKNSASFNNEKAVAIRGDLREKYGMGPLASLDDYRTYLDNVAKNEKGILAYAASQDNGFIQELVHEQGNNIINVGTYFQYSWSDHDNLTVDKVEYKYDSPSFAEFAKEMKEWANKGYWSRNAISNKTSVRDAFENGTSASMVWNAGTVSQAASKILQAHPEWKPEVYDVTPDSIKRLGLYTADGMAVPISSKNPERAFMLLDKLKNDREYYELFQMGIEGKHWIRIDDVLWKEGPDFERFSAGANGQWGVNNAKFRRSKEGAFPAEAELDKIWRTKVVHPITETFVFDETNVKNELAALEQLRTKYRPMLTLGMADNVEATIQEWRDQADKAGLKKVEEELKKQLQAFLDARK